MSESAPSANNPADAENEVRETVRLPAESAVAEMSEADVAKVKTTALALLQGDISVHNACINLVIARRLYNVALQALNRSMDRLQKEQAVELFLVEAMKHQAAQEFTRADLLDQFSRSTLPWLSTELREEKDREIKLAAGEAAAEEIWRRDQIIPIAFEPEPKWDTRSSHGLPGIGRKKTMVLAGHPGAVRCVLDLLMSFALRLKESPQFQRPSVLRLADELVQHNVLHSRESLIFRKLGVNRWLHAGRSVKVLHETVHPFLGSLVRNRIDLCLVDDLAQLIEPPVAGLEPWVVAGTAQRIAHKWALESGCALVCGVPFTASQDATKQWDGILLDTKWTQLEVYTDLVQLVVTEDSETTYQINAMRHNDAANLMRIGSVPRELLLATRRSEPSVETELA